MQSRTRDGSVVPDPWRFLADELPDVTLLRERIAEPGRYYDKHRAIVLRRGMKIEQERRFLWHEIVHALRRDASCEGWLRSRMEQSVEREAARRAMPHRSLMAALERAATWEDFVWLMKVPEPWVRYRYDVAHPTEQSAMSMGCRWSAGEWIA